MKTNRLLRDWLLVLILISSIFLHPSMVNAEPQTQTSDLAISLVIDNSGSMKDYDPDKLRQNASEILIDLMSPEDMLGVVSFSNEANEVFPLQLIGNNKSSLKQDLKDSFEPRGATNYLSALEMATDQLGNAPKESQQLIIFLTDGFPTQELVGGKLPMPEEEYLSRVMGQVDEIAGLAIAIYPIGFGDSNEELLVEMAEVTKGEAAMLSSASEIASSFFDTLSLTKNRIPIADLNELTFQEEEIVVPFTNYTQQVTILMTTKGQELSVEQNGDPIEGLTIETGSNYSILTINREKPGEMSEVSFLVRSDDEVTTFAARDLFYTIEVLEPKTKTVRALFDPIMLEVAINNILDEDMKVEAQVIKNGVPDLNPIILTENEGNYFALYKEVDILGDYEIIFEIKTDAESVAQATSSFSVKNIPVLKSDLELTDEVFLAGESITVTSYLELEELRAVANKHLEITEYLFVLTNEQGDEVSYPLEDDPDKDTGDILKGDGLYTNKLELSEIGEFTGIIKVTGVFKGEEFSQEHTLGKFKVFDGGQLQIKLLENPIKIDKKGLLKMPISFTSSSELEEEITISIPKEIGTVITKTIILPPKQTVEEEIVVNLNSSKSESVELSFSPSNSKLNLIEGQNRTISIYRESTFKAVSDFLEENIIIIGSVISILLAIYLIGEILYRRLVFQTLESLLEVVYYPLVDGVDFKKKLRFNNNNFRIIIGDSDSTGDLSLPNLIQKNQSFVIEISKTLNRPEGLRIIEGYKALFTKNEFIIKIEALYPGYLIYKGKPVTIVTVDQEEAFETGGYHFICNLKSDKIRQRKNLLEGREA